MVINGFLTTSEAAKHLGISQRRVIALIESGRLPAQKVGGIWLIRKEDLSLVEDRKPGRPSQDK